MKKSIDLKLPTTCVPRKIRKLREGREKVEEGPGNDDTIVDIEKEDNSHCRNSDTFKQIYDGSGKKVLSTFKHGAKLGDKRHATRTQILAHGYFLEENWDSTENHSNEVNNQKSTCKLR